MPPAGSEHLDGRNPWLAVIVTTLVFFLVVIDVSAVNVALPSIRDDFGVAESTLGWIISGYNIAVAALLLVAGRYADSLGRKRLFIPGVAIFAVGSMLSAVAPSAGALIAARVVQGIGGAIIAPTAIAVVLPDFPPNKRSTVIGLTGATGALGAVVGPALGAFITDVWSWRGHLLDQCADLRPGARARPRACCVSRRTRRDRARSISSVCRSGPSASRW